MFVKNTSVPSCYGTMNCCSVVVIAHACTALVETTACVCTPDSTSDALLQRRHTKRWLCHMWAMVGGRDTAARINCLWSTEGHHEPIP